MTREEAIEILQGAIKKPNTKDGYLGQAIDMAIKALEQEPKEVENYENEIADLYNRLDIAEYDKERFREALGKIRAEIEELDYITFDGITKRRCLEIIDKYRANKEQE